MSIKWVDRWLSGAGVIGLLLILLVPMAWSIGSKYEGVAFPVTTSLQIFEETDVGAGVSFYVTFHKKRPCEFLGINWYHGADRLVLDFEPDASKSPKTRPTGDQVTGPWLLHGISRLAGTQATVRHRCHPLWVTTTDLYP